MPGPRRRRCMPCFARSSNTSIASVDHVAVVVVAARALSRGKPFLVLLIQGPLGAVEPALPLFRVGADVPAIQACKFGFEVGDSVIASAPGLQVFPVQANYLPLESVSGGVIVQWVVTWVIWRNLGVRGPRNLGVLPPGTWVSGVALNPGSYVSGVPGTPMSGVRAYPGTWVSGVRTLQRDGVVTSLPRAALCLDMPEFLEPTKRSPNLPGGRPKFLRQGGRRRPTAAFTVRIGPEGTKDTKIRPGQPVIEDGCATLTATGPSR